MRAERAIELTLRTVVILVILFICMLVLIVFFTGGFKMLTGEVSHISHKSGLGAEFALGKIICEGRVYSADTDDDAQSACEAECEDKLGCTCEQISSGNYKCVA